MAGWEKFMYHAVFRLEEIRVFQCLIGLREDYSHLQSSSGLSWSWYQSLWEVLLGEPSVETAFRITATAHGIQRLIYIHIPDSRPQLLESVTKYAGQLREVAQADGRVCETKEQHDTFASDAPACVAWVRPPVREYRDCWLLSDYRIGSRLNDLLRSAWLTGRPVSYQMNLRRDTLTSDDLRDLQKNLVRVRMHHELPSRLVEMQASCLERLQRATWAADELLSWSEEDSASPEVLAQLTGASASSAGLGPCRVVTGERDVLKDLRTSGLHSSHTMYPASLPERVGTRIDDDEVRNIALWKPPANWCDVIAAQSSRPAGQDASIPRPPGVAAEFSVFLSASSADYDAASHVYRALTEHGISVFFSPMSLPLLCNSDYRKEIDRALDKADHLLVVATEPQNVLSPWVEAEWGLFINEKRSGRKQGNILTILMSESPIDRLPPSLRYYEVVDWSQPNARPRILKYLSAGKRGASP
jgi:hypothetical protein